MRRVLLGLLVLSPAACDSPTEAREPFTLSVTAPVAVAAKADQRPEVYVCDVPITATASGGEAGETARLEAPVATFEGASGKTKTETLLYRWGPAGLPAGQSATEVHRLIHFHEPFSAEIRIDWFLVRPGQKAWERQEPKVLRLTCR